MRIFVTGASGYIGNAVAKAFRRRGHHVTGLVRSDANAKMLHAQEILSVIGEISQPDTYRKAAADAEVIVHCASESSPDRIARDAHAIETLLSIAHDSTLPRAFLYTSGIMVYGNTHEKVADESTPLNPLPIVSWRPAHETQVLAATTPLLRTVVLRPGFVYGGTGGYTAMWFNDALEKGYVILIENGNNRWPLIHLDDLGEAYALAAEQEHSQAIFNITDGTHFTVREMASAVCLAAGIPLKIESISYDQALKIHGSKTEGILIDQMISNERARRRLNWTPRHTNFIDDAPIYYTAWKARR